MRNRTGRGNLALDVERGAQFRRQWKLLIALRSERLTHKQLARRLAVTTRTVIRDLHVLIDVGLPVRSAGVGCRDDEKVFWIGACAKWPRDEASPVLELRA